MNTVKNTHLTEKEIKTLLGDTKFDIHVSHTVTSTNTILKEYAKNGEKSGFVLIAEEQTAGKGRLGRKFYSPRNTGLYMSLLLRPELTVENALFITTSAAVAVSRAIETVSSGSVNPGIKWVNDIFVNDKKVCGILTESAVNFKTGMLDYAVLGIGVNLLPPKGDFPEDLKNIAAPVFLQNEEQNLRAELAAEILKQLDNLPENFMSDEILQEYRSRSILIGKQVLAVWGNEKKPCTVLDIDNKARLVVKFKNGETKPLSTGEVSIRI